MCKPGSIKELCLGERVPVCVRVCAGVVECDAVETKARGALGFRAVDVDEPAIPSSASCSPPHRDVRPTPQGPTPVSLEYFDAITAPPHTRAHTHARYKTCTAIFLSLSFSPCLSLPLHNNKNKLPFSAVLRSFTVSGF